MKEIKRPEGKHCTTPYPFGVELSEEDIAKQCPFFFQGDYFEICCLFGGPDLNHEYVPYPVPDDPENTEKVWLKAEECLNTPEIIIR